MSGALVISEECLGWARLAGFEHRSDDTAGIVVLWSATGSRYCIRQRGRGRLELSHADGGDDPLARALANCARNAVGECRLYAVDDQVVWKESP